MEYDFWNRRWTKNQIAFHQLEISNYLEDYWDLLKIPQGSQVFIPLCGKSLDMLFFRDRGYQVLGVEFHEIAVRDFFAENNIAFQKIFKKNYTLWFNEKISIIEGDFFFLEKELQDIAAIYDRGALVALPKEMRQRYAKHFVKTLPQNCKILLVTFEYEQQKMDGPPFSVTKEEIEELFSEAFTIEHINSFSVISDYAFLEERGLSDLQEKIYILQKTC